jgi:prephenate dehydrogenase
MEPIASTTYNAMINVAEPVVNENESLYYEIQANNDFQPKLLKEISDSFNKYKVYIESKNEAGFSKLMRSAREYFNSQA